MKTAIGCFLSLTYFAFIGILMLSFMIGDCLPEMGHSCPSDQERNVAIISIFLGGLIIYAAVSFLIIWWGRRKAEGEGD